MKKIAHIGFGGGVAGVMKTLAQGLPEYSHQLIPFGPGTDQRQPGLWSPAYHPLKIWRAMRSVKLALRKASPDLVVLHGYLPTVLAIWPARWAKVPHIIAIDHGPQPTFTTAKAILYFFAFRHLERVISVSQDSLTWQVKHFPYVKPKKMLVIENGVAQPSPPPNVRIATTPPWRLATMARVDFPQKDPLTLLRGAAILRDRGFPFHLDIFGTGNAFERCKKMIKELSLEAQVAMLGQQHNVEQRLPEYDLVVLSTHWEGLPLGLLEAMASGRPIVASNVVGVASLLKNGQLGYLFTESDPTDLANKITLAFQESERTQAQTRAAQQSVRETYTLERMVSRYAQVFNEVLRGR